MYLSQVFWGLAELSYSVVNICMSLPLLFEFSAFVMILFSVFGFLSFDFHFVSGLQFVFLLAFK